MRKTKIICTIGPATHSREKMRELILNGMNVARLNFSHGSHKEHKERINNLKELRTELKVPLAILQDTKGPEIRTTEIEGGFIDVIKDEEIIITADTAKKGKNYIPVTYENIARDMGGKKTILVDDGHVELEVLKIEEKEIYCRVVNSGKIESKKGINIPGAKINLPAISEKDKSDILFGIKNDVDFVAASFVRSQEDVL